MLIVQIQILTSIVKLYLKKPESNQNLVQKVLELSTKNCDNPDIRDRAYIYWRLLSTDPEAAKVGYVFTFHNRFVCRKTKEDMLTLPCPLSSRAVRRSSPKTTYFDTSFYNLTCFIG